MKLVLPEGYRVMVVEGHPNLEAYEFRIFTHPAPGAGHEGVVARRAAKSRGSLADAIRARQECLPCQQAKAEAAARAADTEAPRPAG